MVGKSKIQLQALREHRDILIRYSIEELALLPAEAAWVFKISPQLINSIINKNNENKN